MVYYLSAAGLVAVTIFWGWGLAQLTLPRAWRRWAWVFAPGLGWALQSAVVWAGALGGLAGTNTYARASLLLPAGLLLFALRRPAPRLRGGLGVLVLALAAGWTLLSPLAAPGPGLTSSSLGSCDHADYAAGARVFAEFSRHDRTGFLGLPEVTRVRSADYFFDFWLRLNHFTPSALLAHNASTLGVEPYRLVSVTAAVLVLLNLPAVVFLARFLVGIRGRWLLVLGAFYAWSPFNTYAVAHGALGQLYAQQGILLLTLGVVAAGRFPGAPVRRRALLPLLVAAVWLLAGSYNFILLVSLAPAAAWWAGRCLLRRSLAGTGAAAALTGLALGVCALLFWGRFDGLIERFSLFEQYNFGWVVPLASPEGWLGLLRDTGLHAWPGPVRAVLSALVLAGFAWGVARLWRREPQRALAALALVVPVVAGWAVLALESRARANSSYDAYKILAVFLPGLLAGTACWLAEAGRAGKRLRAVLGVAALAVLAGMLAVDARFRAELSAPPLRVDRRLVEVGTLEQDRRVGSVNMKIEHYWSRLWANAFLLRKPQYFLTHTYEGRLDTPLRGEWDLSDSRLRSIPLRPEDRIVVNDTFHLVRVGAPGYVEARFAGGWYPEEKHGGAWWRWSDGNARLWLVNPSTATVAATLELRLRAQVPGALAVYLGRDLLARPVVQGTEERLVIGGLRVPPGQWELRLASATGRDPGDERPLGLALLDFVLRAE